jgi:helix-turn-helix, Psq domain
MAREYKKKPGCRKYHAYSESSVEKAVRKIKSGKLSLRQASKKFNVPKSTLSNRARGVHSGKPGHSTAFSEQEEQSLLNHIQAVSDWGFPFTTLDMRFFAKSFLDSTGKRVKCFKNNLPSSDWALSFLKRHQASITQRRCQNIKKSRASVSPDTINEYFDNLQKSLCNVDGTLIDPHLIFNYDETNLTDDPGVKRCVFRRGVKYPERIQDGTKASTSVMFC